MNIYVRPSKCLPLCALLALATVLLLPYPSLAQDERQSFWVSVKVADNALAETPAMVSAIRDGEVVRQLERLLLKSPSAERFGLQNLPPGTYDIRIEGDGFITEVKRGVQLFPDGNTELSAVVRPGEGVHIVEYAIGGLAREEVAARLRQLEASVAELQQAQQGQ